MNEKTKMTRVNLDILADRRALEFVLGALESADISNLPPEVADDVCFINRMLSEALQRR